MIIDCHVHLFPRSIREQREKYFSGEPAFELLYASPKARLAGADEILAVMDRQNVEMAVLFGFPWEHADTFRRNNDLILETVARYPDRFRGFACFSPFHPEAAAETERCLSAGLSGVGELAFYRSGLDPFCLECLAPVMQLTQRADVPVMLHTNEPVGHQYPGKTPNTLAQIYALLKSYPHNRIILAHWGGGLFFYSLLKKEVRETLRHVYFDTAASPFLYNPAVYRTAIDIVGAERVLFGSDFPLLGPERYFAEMSASGLSPADRSAICGGNAARLLKIEPLSR